MQAIYRKLRGMGLTAQRAIIGARMLSKLPATYPGDCEWMARSMRTFSEFQVCELSRLIGR